MSGAEPLWKTWMDYFSKHQLLGRASKPSKPWGSFKQTFFWDACYGCTGNHCPRAVWNQTGDVYLICCCVLDLAFGLDAIMEEKSQEGRKENHKRRAMVRKASLVGLCASYCWVFLSTHNQHCMSHSQLKTCICHCHCSGNWHFLCCDGQPNTDG